MSTEKGRASTNLTFWGALQLLFIALKLMGHIDWPWWIVFWPIWLELLILGVAFLILGIIWYIDHRK